MKKYMFGIGNGDYKANAEKLVSLGYDSVVLSGNDISAIEAAQDAGLETWLCYGAHSIGEFSREKYGALDAKDASAPWFGSACPNAAEVNVFNMDRAFETAKKAGVKGIFVDGARFASFASTEGVNSFFGCFCKRCCEKMMKFGINAAAVKNGVAQVMDFLGGADGKDQVPVMHAAIDAWLDFRARCVGEYMKNFSVRAHAEGFDAGAFVFAPSLWWFVGQRPDALATLDVVSPMLYRAYPHTEGPACLSHEWAGMKELLSHTSRTPAQLASMLFDTAIISDDPMAGFEPSHVADETRAARAMLAKNVTLAPIIQTEDARLDETMQFVFDSGATACGEFCYSQKKI